MSDEEPVHQYLKDILEWGDKLKSYIKDIDFDGFVAETMRQDATVRCIEVIGEASSRIRRTQPDFAAKHPELDIENSYRTRNRLAHQYDGLDLVLIWDIANNFVPQQAAAIQKFLAESGKAKN